MKIRRIGAGVALLAASVMAVAACSNNASSSSATSGAAGHTITVAEVNGFSSLNTQTAGGNSDINGKVEQATSQHFWYINSDLKVQTDTGLGSYKVVSQSPLTVKYTINKDQKWSDGEPINADDVVLAWAAWSGYYNSEDGKTVAFDYAGDTTGLGTTSFPQISSDNLSVTLTYAKPFSDWQVALDLDKPAHIVAKKAGLKDAAALTTLLKGIAQHNPANDQTLAKVTKFWNSGYDTTSMPKDKDLLVTSGPFKVADIVNGQSITLEKNDAYTGTQKPKVDRIVIRTIGDPSQMTQALQNGEVDVVAPQASADTLTGLKSVKGAKVVQGYQLSYDHLDLKFSGVFADANVRKAFMLTVPRDQILKAIVTPVDPSAKVLDSQLFVPQQAGYAGSVAANGSSEFDQQNIAEAKTLLAGATPTVRIMYNKDNPNRLDAYTLITQAASQAGFKIVDGGLPKTQWSDALDSGTYDASIFGWINTGVGVSGVPQIFKTGAGSNFNGFSDPAADALMDQLVQTTDTATQTSLMQQIDQKIWASDYGLPLFQTPGVVAYDSRRVIGFEKYNPNQYGVFWNAFDWRVKG